jgi:hypothetical protein
MEKKRPFGVTLLAILAGLLAVIAILRALNWLGFIPWFGPGPAIRTFNLWYAFMFGLLAWVYIWLTQMLWKVDPSAWLFLAVITVFNLIMDFVTVISSNMPTTDLTTLSIWLNALILIYIMLPGVRKSFGTVK